MFNPNVIVYTFYVRFCGKISFFLSFCSPLHARSSFLGWCKYSCLGFLLAFLSLYNQILIGSEVSLLLGRYVTRLNLRTSKLHSEQSNLLTTSSKWMSMTSEVMGGPLVFYWFS